ncbi:hypothetical protein [Nocardiopsis sp. NPDC006938]|uniref:hypothetical protein n=1 Tax=Nocardiopsis sp. NPDC006938 TaxID=3364337 RepID=UPI0036C3172B
MELFIIMATIAFICRDPAGTLKEAANYRRAQAERDQLRGRGGRGRRRRPGSGAMRRYLGTVWEDQWDRAIERYPERMRAAQARRTKRKAKREATWGRVQDTAGRRWDQRFPDRHPEPADVLDVDGDQAPVDWPELDPSPEPEPKKQPAPEPAPEPVADWPAVDPEDPVARQERLDREVRDREQERELLDRERELRDRERELREREDAEILRRVQEILRAQEARARDEAQARDEAKDKDEAKARDEDEGAEPAPAEEPEPSLAQDLSDWRARDTIYEYGRDRPYEPLAKNSDSDSDGAVVDLDAERRRRLSPVPDLETTPEPEPEPKEITPLLNLSDAASLRAHVDALNEHATYWDSTCISKEQLAAGMTTAQMGEATVAAVDASRAAYTHAAAKAREAATALHEANSPVAEARASSPDAAHGDYYKPR